VASQISAEEVWNKLLAGPSACLSLASHVQTQELASLMQHDLPIDHASNRVDREVGLQRPRNRAR
jgi:hypothetical protein